VNLIADREIVKELIQHDFSIPKLKTELQQILGNQVYRGHMLQGYDLIKERIGETSASDTTATLILESLGKK
jgi:lipid-A-disaccharide synthase